MMFDNSPPPSPSNLDRVKAHLPVLLAVGGALVLFIGLHVGAFVVAGAALAHVALGGLLLLAKKLHANEAAS